MSDEKEVLEYTEELAQLAVNMAAFFMPISGMTMLSMGAIAKKAEKFIGKEINPDPLYFGKFIDYQKKLEDGIRSEIISDLQTQLDKYKRAVVEMSSVLARVLESERIKNSECTTITHDPSACGDDHDQ